MGETNRIVLEFTIENWMIYTAVAVMAISLADSTLNIYKYILNRKLDMKNRDHERDKENIKG